MQCILGHYILTLHMVHMTPEQILRKNRFVLDPRSKLLICIECEKNVKCPYCQSEFEDKEVLSYHIDKIHIGPGLLEGNFKGY